MSGDSSGRRAGRRSADREGRRLRSRPAARRDRPAHLEPCCANAHHGVRQAAPRVTASRRVVALVMTRRYPQGSWPKQPRPERAQRQLAGSHQLVTTKRTARAFPDGAVSLSPTSTSTPQAGRSSVRSLAGACPWRTSAIARSVLRGARRRGSRRRQRSSSGVWRSRGRSARAAPLARSAPEQPNRWGCCHHPTHRRPRASTP